MVYYALSLRSNLTYNVLSALCSPLNLAIHFCTSVKKEKTTSVVKLTQPTMNKSITALSCLIIITQRVILSRVLSSSLISDVCSKTMGNGDLVDNTIAFSPGAGAGIDNNSGSPTKRRVVKAAKPSPSAEREASAADPDELEDTGVVSPNKKLVDKLDSLSYDEDDQVESLQSRIVTMEERQRLRRDQTLKERRTNPKSKSTKESPQPNPFSRFMRVFSVEPAYPEHKRSYQGENGGEEPVVKKPRSTDAESDSDDDADLPPSSIFSPIGIGAAAAFIAVVVMALLRFKPKK